MFINIIHFCVFVFVDKWDRSSKKGCIYLSGVETPNKCGLKTLITLCYWVRRLRESLLSIWRARPCDYVKTDRLKFDASDVSYVSWHS